MAEEPLVRFAVGDGTAFVAPDRLAVAAGDAGSATARTLRSLVAGRRSLADVMTELSHLGFEHLESFALVVMDRQDDGATSARLLHRGDVTVTVERSDGPALTFHQPQVATWREEFVDVPRAVRAELGSVDATLLAFWCDGQAEIPAVALRWTPRADAPADDPGTDLFVTEAAAPAPVAAAHEEPEVERRGDHIAAAALDPAVDAPTPAEPAAEPPPLPAPELPAPERGPSAPPSGEADDIDFANLVHHTVFRRPEEAAVRAAEDDGARSEPPGASQAGSSNAPPSPGPILPPSDASGAPAPPPFTSDATRAWRDGPATGMIDAVPPAGASAPGPPATAPAVVVGDSDHDGFTVARRPARDAPAGATPAGGKRPAVHAVRCPNGHLNPPPAPSCRICAAPIADRAARTEPRPQLGVIRFSTGHTAVIDGPLVVGRNPPSGIQIDGEHAATVAIDDSEISRYHLAVRVAEWYVSVEDQGSTNGTVVRLPGKADQTLRPHERVQIVVGSEVELGGNVTLRYEAT